MVDSERAHLKREGVYEHLGKLIDRVVAEKPQDAYGLVEVLSRLVKATPAASPAEAAPSPEDAEALAEYVKKARQLDQVPSDEGNPIPVCAIPDFMEDAEMLSWAGVGFGELESYRIMCSLRNLAAKQKDAGMQKLRLWGKILGSEADYYVAEAQQEGGGDGDAEGEDPDMEPSGQPGVNQYTYYVTNDLCGDWQRLPNIKPREIVAARLIKRLVSGDPKTPVVTHPFFEGTEAVLLRAQIARITADTVLCVKGYLARGEEEDSPIEENPEFLYPLPSDLLKKEAWTHMQPHILKNGRCTYKELPEEDEENAAFLAKAKLEMEADPERDLIRGLVDDDKLEWVVKQAGDTALYKSTSGLPTSSAVTYVRCLAWPGAVSIAKGTGRSGRFVNLYVGYGLPAGQPDFFPPAPPDIQDEPEDPGEVPEPQGKEEVGEAPEGADD